MIIAIPSVTQYINNSRKSAYVDTAKEIIAGARNKVNEGKLEMFSTETTYYIPASCIGTENGQKSPYGDFDQAYVLVTYDGSGYNYYWVSRDVTGQGIKDPTAAADLDVDDIDSDIAFDYIKTTVPAPESGKTKIQILQNNCETFEENENDIAVYPVGKDKSSVEVGDIVTIGTKEFYVVSNDGTDLVLLAHYNLKVGYKNNSLSVIGTYSNSDEGYGLQSSEAKGYLSSTNKWNGTLGFSSWSYWREKVGDNKDYSGKYCKDEDEVD